MGTSTIALANTFILKGAKENIPLTLMKLQRLLYLLYRQYYQATGRKLFTECFEKWKYGAVLPSVYYCFRDFGANPITRFARNAVGAVEVLELKHGTELYGIFTEVWERYKYFSPVYLSDMLQKENTAWSRALNGILQDEDIMKESAEQQ